MLGNCAHAGTHDNVTPIEYNRDIRPILADNCFKCHGQDAGSREAKLRLDIREDAILGGKSGMAALVPGKPDESELLLRVTSEYDDERMPPADSAREPLKPAEVEKLRQWISQGAKYQAHWAFIPPTRPEVPAGKSVSPIDRLVDVKRAGAGLSPSPEASPETLCRRVHLDLTGLPPTLAELDSFVSAYARLGESAYVKLVDKLLASPRYGEKWARLWLDAARYADSDGYEKDLPREQWAWRDWVIDAMNSDKPYDRFIIEQIAGDLMVAPTQSSREQQDLRVATGFLRNSMVSQEGAIVAEQYRKEGMFDRMDCLGKAVLGITLQCAQCHTHKFDPITQTEYYQLFAAIDDTYEAIERVYDPDALKAIGRLKQELAEINSQAQAAHPGWQSEVESWAGTFVKSGTPWEVLHPTAPTWEDGLAHPEALPDGSVITLGFRPNDGDLWFTSRKPLTQVTGIRLEALTHGDLIFQGPGRNIEGLFAVSELIIETRPIGAKEGKKHALVDAKADFESPERGMEDPFRKNDTDKRLLGPSAFLIDGKVDTAWAPDRGTGRRNAPVELTARFAEPLTLPEGQELVCRLRFKHGGADAHGRKNNHLGRYRVSLTRAQSPFTAPVRPDVREAATLPSGKRTAEQKNLLFTAWREANPEFKALNEAARRLWETFPKARTSVLNLAARAPEETRQTHRLDRGAWDKPKEPVTFATPAFLPPLKSHGEPARLEFARWLVDRGSPTAARVESNRIWQALFGLGLVDTPEDFGVRAPMPEQQPLLDWLAVELMENGWSRKKLIRKVLLSKTYRQSSVADAALRERDPRNRLFARGPRFRADAEIVRDSALLAAGLLHEQIGGPSVFPPVPKSLFAESYLDVDFWKTATGTNRYRRSLYVFRRRSMPDPVLASFDAPNGDSACVVRPRSNTPLAALTALNETVFVEAAQAFALRVLREGGSTDAQRADYAFRLCTGRHPHADEVDDLVALAASSRARMVDGWIPARVVAFGDGDTLPSLPPRTTPNDAAAWTLCGRVLFNLDETLTKD
ncbi:MAG: PSD1 domain-containing protein [Opitutaceae bacterium]|nr:PSD1 domain-containing protein [Opitutaceae bacterium]